MTEHLGDHALLGDLHTVALVSRRGGLDWLCLPRVDSAAPFTSAVHDDTHGDTNGERGGTWVVAPEQAGRATRRRYRPGTLVLESEWDTPDGTVRVVDCMPPRADQARVVRVVEGVTGRVPMHTLFEPRFDDGERTPWLRCTGTAVSAVAGSDALWLDADVPLARVPGRSAAAARFTVAAGERVGFVLTHTSSHLPRPAAADAVDLVGATARFWSTWSAGMDGGGPREDAVRRAAITLKALTHAPTGAIVTTPVFRSGRPHLCEVTGASSTLRALLDAGLADEARAWREWLVRAVAGDPRDAATRYTVDGRGDPSTRTRGAGLLGEVLHTVNAADHLWLSSQDPAWDLQLDLLDHLESTWDEPDGSGASPGHLVAAKVRAWAGLDQAVRAAERHGLPGPVHRWRAAQSRLRAEVCSKGYDPHRNTFTGGYGTDVVDAALLMLPEVGFLPWRDVRVRGTIRAITTALTDGDGPGSLTPGTPLTDGFRLAAALRGTGDTAAANALFEQLLTARNDVGLFGEFHDPTGRRLGRTPHAASAAGMINAALRLRPAPTFATTTNAD